MNKNENKCKTCSVLQDYFFKVICDTVTAFFDDKDVDY